MLSLSLFSFILVGAKSGWVLSSALYSVLVKPWDRCGHECYLPDWIMQCHVWFHLRTCFFFSWYHIDKLFQFYDILSLWYVSCFLWLPSTISPVLDKSSGIIALSFSISSSELFGFSFSFSIHFNVTFSNEFCRRLYQDYQFRFPFSSYCKTSQLFVLNKFPDMASGINEEIDSKICHSILSFASAINTKW